MRYHEDTLVCHSYTVRWGFRILVAAGAVAALCAQIPQNWRHIGNSAVEIGLASPVTGPVAAVWFSPDGAQLFARTQAGTVFVSGDLENWTLAPANTPLREPLPAPASTRLPEPRALLRAGREGRTYALGANVYASEDGGRTWINLTGYNNKSVIGAGGHDLAVSPRDAQLLVVANDFGVWRSNDGGLSWSCLNENLPNLSVHEIVDAAVPLSALHVAVNGIGTVEPDPAVQSWRVASPTQPGQDDRARASAALGAQITALSGSGDTWYAGSADGRLWVSTDRRTTWTLSPVQVNGAIERLYSDPEAPRIAFAAAAGTGAHLFRTINSGLFWDDITGSLTTAPAHGIAADRAGGAVYVATDRGVFLSRMDVNALGAVSAWTQVSSTKANDVKLNATSTELLVAVDGYGVYTTAAPHSAGTVRLVNAADMSQRAAAPGSLYSVLGAQIQFARAGNTFFPVLAAAAGGSQIQVPFDINASQVDLTLQRASGPLTLGLAIKPVSPAIFVDRDGAPMLLDAETGLMLDAATTAHSRARIQVLATGLGKVKPEWPSGIAAPSENPPAVAANVEAFLNGVPVQVTKATLAPGYVGLYLVEIQIPAVLDSGISELYLAADGQESNRVRVAVDALN
jgi:uncharacterized protein (TIGR03437 family)